MTLVNWLVLFGLHQNKRWVKCIKYTRAHQSASSNSICVFILFTSKMIYVGKLKGNKINGFILILNKNIAERNNTHKIL